MRAGRPPARTNHKITESLMTISLGSGETHVPATPEPSGEHTVERPSLNQGPSYGLFFDDLELPSLLWASDMSRMQDYVDL